MKTTIFIDFLQGLLEEKSSTSPLKNGTVCFYPSENSDKTYVGRMLIDLNNIMIGENTTLYQYLKENPSGSGFQLTVRQELFEFYNTALNNINSVWEKIDNLINQELDNYLDPFDSNNIPTTKTQYGNWEKINALAKKAGLTPL